MKNITRLFILPLTVVTGGLALIDKPAHAASFNCTSSAQGGRAYIACTRIEGGEVRGRADCKRFPDKYTPWFSTPGGARTHKCPWGIRKAITEFREK